MEDLLQKVKAIDLRMVMEDLGYRTVQNRRMMCPFHDDKSPSLVIYPPPQNEFHCFGCGKHGDVLNFFAEVNGISFKEALERLAFTYIPGYNPERQRPFKNEPKLQVFQKKDPAESYVYQAKHSEIYEDFRTFCRDYPTTQSTLDGIKYLQNRGISDWGIRHFNVFFLKNYQAANQFLKNRYCLIDLQNAGLMNEKGNLIFYVHPLLFPHYHNGKIIYLQGRTIGSPKDRASKYQFLKGVPRPMFNHDILKTLRRGSVIYLTEGVIDCMTLVQHGHAAISLGSSQHFKPTWAKLFTPFRVFVWFDNDAAGQSGAATLLETLRFHGVVAENKTTPSNFNDINEYFASKD